MDKDSESLAQLNEQLQSDVNQLAARHKKLLANMTLQEAKIKLKETHSEVCIYVDQLL